MKSRSILMNVALAATLGLVSLNSAKAQTGGNYSWWTKAAFPGSFQLKGGSDAGELSGAYTGFSPATVDTVTIGARVPYFIEGDPTINGYVNATPPKLNPSQFKWVFTKSLPAGTPPALYGAPTDTLNLIVNQGLSKTLAIKSDVAFNGNVGGSYVASADLRGKGYYNVGSSTEVSAFNPALDLTKGMKEINVKFNANTQSTAGSTVTSNSIVPGDLIYLLSNEVAVTTAGVPMCEGVDASTGIGDSVALIKVVDVPLLKWKNLTHSDVVACSTDSLSFGGMTQIYGYGPFVVRYEIEAGTYDASTSTFTAFGPSSIDSTLFGTTKDVYPVGGSSAYEYLFLPGSAFNSATPTTNYRVTFLGLTDRFSRKSLDPVPGVIPSGGVAAGDPGDPTFVINVIDAPKTKKLKHVKNNRG